MKLPEPEIRKARIEIIPMIDTIFFLLVFFMFSTLSMVRMKGLDVPLPKPIPTAAGQVTREIVVAVSASGQYSVDKVDVTPDALRAALVQRIAAEPNAVVVAHVADTQPTQALITVMDALSAVPAPNGRTVPVLVGTEKVSVGQEAGHEPH